MRNDDWSYTFLVLRAPEGGRAGAFARARMGSEGRDPARAFSSEELTRLVAALRGAHRGLKQKRARGRATYASEAEAQAVRLRDEEVCVEIDGDAVWIGLHTWPSRGESPEVLARVWSYFDALLSVCDDLVVYDGVLNRVLDLVLDRGEVLAELQRDRPLRNRVIDTVFSGFSFYGNGRALFGLLFCLGIGGFGAYQAGKVVHRDLTWGEVEGTVRSIDVQPSGETHRVSIGYEYEVGAQIHAGRQSDGTLAFRDEARAQAVVDAHPPGSKLTVRHDPDAPESSTVAFGSIVPGLVTAILFWALALLPLRRFRGRLRARRAAKTWSAGLGPKPGAA